MKLLIAVFVVVALAASGALAGWRPHRRQRGCRRAAGQGITEEGTGGRFVWNMTGLDDDDISVTFKEGAFAPDDAATVFKFPRDRGQRVLGLAPAKIVYDYSTDEPVVVIRLGRYGRGSCIVVSPDVDTYDELIGMLFLRNMTDVDVPEEEQSVRLTATQAQDDSQFSNVVRDVCSRDQCGGPVQAVFYTTEPAIDEVDEEDDEGEDEDFVLEFEPSFLLLNSRVTISGLPHPRQQFWHRRQDRRQSRRQHAAGGGRRQQWRPDRRQQQRQQRRNRWRQGEDDRF